MIKQFELGSRTIQVKEIDVAFESVSQTGESDNASGIIRVANKARGVKSIPDDARNVILYHEVFHMILDELAYDELSSNESFVQSVAVLLAQFDKTKK